MKSGKKKSIAMALAGLGSRAVTGALLVGLACQLLAPAAFAQTKPAVELEGAIAREQVDGDLKTAIAAYQKIAANRSASRDVRAKALLHLAGCYEKLGQQAQKVYEQIVRDFADQPAAAQARARLAAIQQADRPAVPATMTQRRIETLDRDLGPYPNETTDGHRAVYRNDSTGELIYGDLAGKGKRIIFKGKPDDESRWFPSRDFSIVALLLSPKTNEPKTLAVVNTDGTGYREIARLEPSQYYYDVKWSWDNRSIFVSGFEFLPGRLLRISVADGKTRELLNLTTGSVGYAALSPDGRFVAYQSRGGIFILPAAGGQPQPVYEERPTVAAQVSLSAGTSFWLTLFDWTADGRYLAVASERTGKPALHLLPIKDGKAAGAPVFLRYGHFESARTTATGELVYSSIKPGGLWAVHLASLDSNSRLSDWKRLDLQLGNNSKPWARLSGDGNQIVYVATNEDAGQTGSEVVRLRNLSTGDDREIHHGRGLTSCIWAVQQPKLFCVEQSAGKADILSIGVDSGEIARLHTFKGSFVVILSHSPDGRALYMYLSDNVPSTATTLLRWEIATGLETIVERNLAGGPVPWASPDERSLVWPRKEGFQTRPMSGGDWKPLVSLSTGVFVPRSVLGVLMGNGRFGITPDGNWLLYVDVDSAGKHSVFRVPLAGGKPERLGDFPSDSVEGTLAISPDGRQVIVESWEGANGYEVWSLENFVPSGSKR